VTARLDILLAAVSSPDLPGALCKGRTLWDLLPGTDPEHDYARDRAISLCRHQCPVLKQCVAWLHSLPPDQRPHGCVVAGQVQQRAKPHKHKSSEPTPKPETRLHAAAMAALAEYEKRTRS
jgi:hypothetical protein